MNNSKVLRTNFFAKLFFGVFFAITVLLAGFAIFPSNQINKVYADGEDIITPTAFTTTYNSDEGAGLVGYTITGFDATVEQWTTMTETQKVNIHISIPATYDDGVNGVANVVAIGQNAFECDSNGKYKSDYIFTQIDMTGATNLDEIKDSAFINSKNINTIYLPTDATYGENVFTKTNAIIIASNGTKYSELKTGSLSAYESQLTYEVSVTFDNATTTTGVANTIETKLYGKSFKMTKNEETGDWVEYSNYQFPTITSYGYYICGYNTTAGQTEATISTTTNVESSTIYLAYKNLVFDSEYDDINQTYTITKYNAKYLQTLIVPHNITIVIPATYDDGVNGEHEVVAIAPAAFCCEDFVVDEDLPDIDVSEYVTNNYSGIEFTGLDLSGATNLERIGEYAFYASTITGELVIPDSVEEIAVGAFFKSSFTKLTLGSGVKVIGEVAFFKSALTGSLVVPDSVEKIKAYAFAYTQFGFVEEEEISEANAGTLTLGNGLTTVGPFAFAHIAKPFTSADDDKYLVGGFVGELTIPNNVETIGEFAFNYAGFTEYLTIGTGLTEIKVGAFSGCGFTGSLVIPENIITIGPMAFMGCQFGAISVDPEDPRNAGTLTLGSNLQTIGEAAFACIGVDYKTLEMVEEILNNMEEFMASGDPTEVLLIILPALFSDGGFTGDLIIPNSVENLGMIAFALSGFDGYLDVGNGVESIAPLTFAFTHFRGNLYLGESVIDIGDFAFAGTAISISDGTKSMYESFMATPINDRDSSMLIFIMAQMLVDIINSSKTEGFTGDLYIPDNVETIGLASFAFSGFNGSLYISNNIETIPEGAFLLDAFTGNLTIGRNVKYIDGFSFLGIALGSNFTGDDIVDLISTMESPTDLINFIIDVLVDMLDGSTTRGFTGDLIISNNVETIGSAAFAFAGFTGNLTIGNAVETIEPATFMFCNFKGELKMGNSLSAIGSFAFAGIGFNGFSKEEVPSLVPGEQIIRIMNPLKNLISSITDFNEEENRLNGLTPEEVEALTLQEKNTAIEDACALYDSIFENLTEFVSILLSDTIDNTSGFTGDLIISNNVTTLESGAFLLAGFTGNLVIGNSVVAVGTNYNIPLGSLIGGSVSDITIPGLTFAFCGFTGTLTIGSSVQTIGDLSFIGCKFVGDLVIPYNVTEIGVLAFALTNFDGTLTLGQNVEYIGPFAFAFIGYNGTYEEFATELMPFIIKTVTPETKYRIYDIYGVENLELYEKIQIEYQENLTEEVYEFLDGKFINGFVGDLILPAKISSIELGTFMFAGFDGDLISLWQEDPEIKGLHLEDIGMNAFAYCDFGMSSSNNLFLIHVENAIDGYAFVGCSHMEYVAIYAYRYRENIFGVYDANKSYPTIIMNEAGAYYEATTPILIFEADPEDPESVDEYAYHELYQYRDITTYFIGLKFVKGTIKTFPYGEDGIEQIKIYGFELNWVVDEYERRVYQNSAYSLPTLTEEDGYAVGWSATSGSDISSATGDMVLNETTFPDDYILYANRNAALYPITIEVEGSEYGSVDVGQVIDVPHGTEIVVNENTLDINGTIITATPLDNTAEFTYTFAWENETAEVTGPRTIKVIFTRTTNKYDVTLALNVEGYGTIDATKFEDILYGTVLSVNDDKQLVVNGNLVTPTTTDNTAQYTYIFDGWTDGETTVVGDTVVTANFRRELNHYTVNVLVNDDFGILTTEAVEDVPYGTTLTTFANGLIVNGTTVTATPHDDTAQYSYAFVDWTNGTITVDGEENVTANFSRTLNNYTITWMNGTEVVEKDENVPYGTTPEFNSQDPTKTANAEHTYTFAGWDKDPATVVGDEVYLATFSSDVNEYYVTIVSNNTDNGTVNIAKVENIPYGTTLTFIGNKLRVNGTEVTATPTANTTAYTYAFVDWTNGDAIVQGNLEVTANFSKTINKYTITWKNEGKTIETDTNLDYGVLPTYDGEVPTKLATAEFTYIFDNWDTEVTEVTGNKTYTAKYISVVNKYKVTVEINTDGYGTTDFALIEEIPYNTALSVNTSKQLVVGEKVVTATPALNTAEYTYSFMAWTNGNATVRGDVKVIANFKRVVNKYTVTIATNGSYGTVNFATVENVPYGTELTTSTNVLVINGTPVIATPTANTAQYSYTFTGWSNGTITVDGDEDVTANFAREVNKYTVIWKNGETTLETVTNVVYGTTPEYNGETPTQTAPAGLKYQFAGWDKTPAPISQDVTYTAKFNSLVDKFTVEIEANEYGYGTFNIQTIENVPYGTVPTIVDGKLIVNGSSITATPSERTAQYTYEFDSWENASEEITGNKTIVANFTRTVNKYAVVWRNGGVILETDENVAYGTTPEFNGEDPTKTATAELTYTFAGWTPVVAPVTGNVVYEANFSSVVNTYTITISINNAEYGAVSALTVANVPYGTVLAVNGNKLTVNGTEVTATATARTAQYTYAFANWTDGTITVDGDKTVTANFTRTLNKYTVVWKNGTETLETDTDVEYGTTPTYDGVTPTTPSTNSIVYAFTGWNKEVTAVVADVTYTAQFKATEIKNETSSIKVPGGINEDATFVVSRDQNPVENVEIPDGKEMIDTFNANVIEGTEDISSTLQGQDMVVKIKVDTEKYNRKNVKVIYVSPDGVQKEVDTTLDGDYLVMTTQDLGRYVVIADEIKSFSLYIILGGAALVLVGITAGMVAIIKRKHKGYGGVKAQ